MAVTIKDIAKQSGFGVGTVSRVLNGSPMVKNETRERVMQIARELNYRPNKVAKMLVTGRFSQSTIGIVLPKITHRFSMAIVSGIYTKLNELGYNLLVFNIGKKREEVFEHIRYSHFSGLLVLLGPLREDEELMLKSENAHFVYLDYHDKNENSIFYNNHLGGGLAARYLIDKRCRNIMLVGDRAKTVQREERFRGFKDKLTEEGIELFAEEYIEADEKAAYRLTKKVIKAGRTDGIFFYSDDLALGGLRAKREMQSGIRIIGYDDIEAAGFLNLSTVRQNAHTLGKLGAQTIVEILKSEKSIHETRPVYKCLKPELIDRGS
ncbi:MAG: LacI family DNA-binding transcriptional regulator [Spirochaetales bacterium]|nr:LacI family DNA-binding transcriptional regulator [Spirochaetales bacterium]